MTGQDGGGQLDDALMQALFRAVTGNVDSYLTCVDRERRILFLNRTLSRDISAILRRRLEDFLAPEHREAMIECVERAFSTSSPQELEYSAVLADGRRALQLWTRVIPFSGPRGEELALMITTDVTEQRRMAEELQQSVEFRRRIVEHLPDFVVLMDRAHRFIWVNRMAPQLSQGEVIGTKVDSFVSQDGIPKAHAAIDAAFESGRTGYYEIEGYGDGQSPAWYSVRVAPVMSEGKVENVLLVTSDITERKRAEQALREAEEQLHRAQRLESLGQLAGGIAHDFNNLLQIISGNLIFAKEGLESGAAALEDLEHALRATERAGELTAHLLAIGRRTRVVPRRCDLGVLVERAVRMLRRTIPETIQLQYDDPAAPCFVDIDPPQFEQVLINLCVNARDAMPQGGTLSIRIDVEGDAEVVMSVSDTGTGIAPENQARIFEPFFTTKGAGSGLGLAVAAGIMAAHGGHITVDSDGRSGSTFKVRLPRVPAGSEPLVATDDAPERGSGVILVAEDEALVRAQVERILERAGYTVLQADNGARAVELFREHAGAVDLVLLDVVMPELDGWNAYVQMTALKPGVKVLFTTGYATSVLPADFAARGARLISKPYKPQRLLAEVRELLTRRVQA